MKKNSLKTVLKSTSVVIGFGVLSFVMCRVGAKLRARDEQKQMHPHPRFIPAFLKGMMK